MTIPNFRFCDIVRNARLQTMRDKIAPILANRVHRHFTDHSVDHSDRVAALAEMLASALPEDKRLAIQLTSMGVSWLQLFDHDTVDVVNLAPQGYFPSDVGLPKVDALAQLLRQINPDTQLHLCPERFRRSTEDYGNVIFVCVDSIGTRKLIFEAIGQTVDFLCDGRMSAESMRILTVTDPGSRSHYPTTLFSSGEAFRGGCTAKSTIYCASIAAGLMVGQFTKWLRRMPVDRDLSANLLAGEMVAA